MSERHPSKYTVEELIDVTESPEEDFVLRKLIRRVKDFQSGLPKKEEVVTVYVCSSSDESQGTVTALIVKAIENANLVWKLIPADALVLASYLSEHLSDECLCDVAEHTRVVIEQVRTAPTGLKP